MDDTYQKICSYKRSMMLAKAMLERDIISREDYAKIDKIIAKKAGITSCSIYRQNP